VIETHDSRERILETATRLFIAQGYRGISMREIAEAVGVSKPAIYHHFSDKEALFLAILNRNVQGLSANIQQAHRSSAHSAAAIESIIRIVLEQPVEQRAVLRMATQDMVHLSDQARQKFVEQYYVTFLGTIRAVFEQGIAAGELRAIDPIVATWALLGILFPYSNTNSPPATEEIVQQVITIFLQGIAAD
jgi:AcrR family transcriptional regulator